MSPNSILDRGKAHATKIAKVQAETPSSFTVGGTFERRAGHAYVATGGISYDRKWSNGWGLTAYANAWWNDKPVVPTDKLGCAVGVEAVKKF